MSGVHPEYALAPPLFWWEVLNKSYCNFFIKICKPQSLSSVISLKNLLTQGLV